MKRKPPLWLRALRVLLFAYLAVLLLLYVFRASIQFPGLGRGRGLKLAFDPEVELFGLRVEGVGTIRVAARGAPTAPRGTMLFFGGNSEGMDRANYWTRLFAKDYRLFAVGVEHPGYGESEGTPSVAAFHAVARAVIQEAKSRGWPRPYFATGNSLGTHYAMFLASEGLVERAVLRSPYTTIGDVAAARFPFLPVRWLLHHDFDNLSLAPLAQCPVLVLHGARDASIPVELGRRLAAALGDNGRFLELADRGHGNVPLERDDVLGERIESFLFTEPPSKRPR
ncbi:MAG: alpha/beta hydrolase [Planctomycetota bacterium]